MKKITYFIMAFAMITVSCTQEEKSSIKGTWQTVASETIKPDTVILGSGDGIEIAMYGEKYVCYFWQEEPKSESDKFFQGFSFGTYSFENGVYKDSIVYSSFSDNIGDKSSANVQFKEDTMVFLWDFPDHPEIKVTVFYKKMD
jgi:hypothetical protein